ncbi:MAG TPA: MAPEG family protein [Noviherbaspirillum sp.]|uniref:MAPEG family protein n=1 Tax=Noviherbaspirillum sp. TaxID=1926288 RepID=UPI002D48A38B|nr:MAPEG family protein [Noviherbaspirillum sp.]HYD94555.1 MAPEG family protein [Noviherbaspirillum sp.]
MRNISILYPVFVLAFWTVLVLLLVPVARFRAALRREVGVEDFRFGESSRVPPAVSIPNRNYMNLLELPVLFYVVCLIIHTSGTTGPASLALAWTYVALRLVHSAIHLTYNNVIHRLAAFATSNVVLVVLWILAAVRVTASA